MKPAQRVVLGLLVAGTALVSLDCAKRGVPPGGPEDRTAPFVAGLSPASGSVGVDRASEITITFSEPMKHRTVETAVMVSPPCKWTKRYWRENTYILVAERKLSTETTYLVSVGTAAADRHGVKMEKSFAGGFSTGYVIEAGRISGKVSWKTLTVEQAVVGVFDVADLGELSKWPEADPVYVTFSGAGGAYEIPYVNTKRTYRVVAFMDKNGNAAYDSDEIMGCAHGQVALTDSAAAATGVDILICDTRFEGSLEGRVYVSAAPDTAGGSEPFKVAVTARSLTDTSASYRTLCGKDGLFAINCMKPGEYVIQAFSDYNGNQKKDPQDSFYVEFGDTVGIASCSEPPEVDMTLTTEIKP